MESTSFVGFVGGLQQFCWTVFTRGKTPVFSVSLYGTVHSAFRVQLQCALAAPPAWKPELSLGEQGQVWLEPCMPQVLSRGWVLARQPLRWALQQRGSWPGERSPRGNLRDVKGCCWWILKEGFYCSGIFSVYFSWWCCLDVLLKVCRRAGDLNFPRVYGTHISGL